MLVLTCVDGIARDVIGVFQTNEDCRTKTVMFYPLGNGIGNVRTASTNLVSRERKESLGPRGSAGGAGEDRGVL